MLHLVFTIGNVAGVNTSSICIVQLRVSRCSRSTAISFLHTLFKIWMLCRYGARCVLLLGWKHPVDACGPLECCIKIH